MTVKLHRFEPKRPGEIVAIKFPFSRELAAGETLTGAPTITVTLRAGADADPQALLAGAPALGADYVLALFGPGVDGAQYLIECLADTTAGQRLQREGVLPVSAPR